MTEQSESRLLEAVARLLEAEARIQAEVVHEWLLDLNELLYGHRGVGVNALDLGV
jgi:hypothetical protein